MIDTLTLTTIPAEDEALRVEVRAFVGEAVAGVPPHFRARSSAGFDANFSRALAARGRAEANWLAARIAVNPGPTLRKIKRLLREGEHSRIESLLALSAGYQALAHRVWEHREAVTAICEARSPQWPGRPTWRLTSRSAISAR